MKMGKIAAVLVLTCSLVGALGLPGCSGDSTPGDMDGAEVTSAAESSE